MWNISLNGVYKKRKIRKKLEQIPLEEERRIREGEIARTKRLARRKIIFAEKRNTAKQMLNDNISVEKYQSILACLKMK